LLVSLTPKTGGSDDFSFSCYGLPTFGLGAHPWDYFEYAWHSTRDTPDKIVFDDLKSNATLLAILVYLASENPTTITRERVDLAAEVARIKATLALGSQNSYPTTWPACTKDPRSTRPVCSNGRMGPHIGSRVASR